MRAGTACDRQCGPRELEAQRKDEVAAVLEHDRDGAVREERAHQEEEGEVDGADGADGARVGGEEGEADPVSEGTVRGTCVRVRSMAWPRARVTPARRTLRRSWY